MTFCFGRPIPSDTKKYLVFWVVVQCCAWGFGLPHDNCITRAFSYSATSFNVVSLLGLVASSVMANIIYFRLFMGDPGYVKLEPDKCVALNAEQLQDFTRFCDVCKIPLPWRSRHCYDCNRCVHTYDHHCVWIGTCVGELNHSGFWWFNFWASCMLLLGSAAHYDSVAAVDAAAAAATSSWLVAVWSRWIPAAMCGLLCMLLLFTSGMLLTHTMIAVVNQTTWEFKKRYKIPYLQHIPYSVCPFDEGVYVNLFYFFCLARRLYPRQWAYSKEDIV